MSRSREHDITGARHDELDALRASTARQQAHAHGAELRWSTLRLVTFAVALAGWIPVRAWPVAAFAVVAGGLVAFGFAIRRHILARRERVARDRELAMLDESRQRIGGTVVALRRSTRPADLSPAEATPSFTPPRQTWPLTGQERDDLDCFAAPVGLYGLLNRTSTRRGAVCLRDWLENPLLDQEAIFARQDAVRWLAEHPAQRVRLLAATSGLREEDARLAKLTSAIRDAAPVPLPAPIGALRAWSLISGIAAVVIAVAALSGMTGVSWLLAPLLVVNASVITRFGKRYTAALAPWRDTGWAASGLNAAAQQAARDLPAEGPLLRYRDAFAHVADASALPALAARVGWSEHGGFLQVLLNWLTLVDLHVAHAVTAPALRQRDALLAAIAALGELEALLSLACFAWEQPRTCWPQFVPGKTLRLVGGVHPLLDPQRAVPNDVALDESLRVWIVTGSNMGGKSTLLRMLGVNVLLAQVGSAAVCEELAQPILRLMTDLRARDDLAARESYFMAEVRHLHRMILPPSGATPILGLIDEPFRGTNSEEQTAASVAVARHLIASGHLFVVATHDRALTTLADGQPARNFHFREDLHSDGLAFDYRLHDGPAQTRNALKILAREGYPEPLVDDAKRWLTARDGAHAEREISER